jgi:uncharacterized repeat protein (TIGR01451 family)
MQIMTTLLRRHSLRLFATIIFMLSIMTASVSLNAQMGRDTPYNGTDIHLHKFQPRVTPEQASQPAPGQSADDFTAQQIVAMEQEKNSRTPAQQKIDSNLLYTMRMLRGQAPAPGVPFLYTGVDLDENNNMVVDIAANVTDSLLQQLNSAGALVWYANADFHSIRAVISPDELENIAASPDVIFISPKIGSITAGTGLLRTRLQRPGFAQRAARIRKQLIAALAARAGGVANAPGQGSIDTQGDLTHRAADARATFSVNGAGLKIGVLSDSANATGALTAAQTSGDMPPTCPVVTGPCFTMIQDFGGGSDEGTAMMEIIYDLAPGANLFFATADVSEAGFAQNIVNLQSVSHCDIIVDDVFYFDEPVFQDGVIAQAVNTVTTAGALYFSSAGNEGNVDSSTAGYFEGDFNDAGSPAFVFPGGAKTGTIHNFGTVPTPVNGDIITARGDAYTLNWSDPQGGSGNDYDLFLVTSTGTIKAQSTNIQSGTQNPFEQINPPALVAGDRLVVFKTTAAAVRAFAINTIRGTLTVVTSGQTHGHSAASGTGIYSVAATPAAAAFNGVSPVGPFPNPFNSTNVVEPFTSDGPRRVFFSSNGTAITPGNFLFGTNGGTVRSKPDITAADGVSTTLPGNSGLNPFYGTSAAAPHAAAVAALIKSFNPALTQTQIRTALTSTAIDIMGAGNDRDSGAGIVMAWEAINSLNAPGGPDLLVGTVTASENPGNGDGVIEAGEGGKLVVQLKNTGGTTATAISATLATSTPGVTMTLPGTSAYADLATGASGNNTTPFAFTVASNAPCALVINFTLTINYTGAVQPTVLNLSVQTGMFSFNNNLGTTPPTVTGVTTLTSTQTNRISRNGVVSACGSTKAFPGTVAVTNRTFDSYTFTACKAACLAPVLNASNGGNILLSAYSPSYDPANIATNYAGDAGSSSSTATFGVSTAASTAYTVVATDASASGNAGGSNYTLQIPACFVSCNINQLPIAVVHNVTVVSAVPGGSANASIDNGSHDPDDATNTLTITQNPAGPYPHGVTTVLLTVTDPKGASAQASATVTVVDAALGFTKAFGVAGMPPNGTTTLMFTVQNNEASLTLTGIGFSDTLPAGLVISTPNGLSGSCGGGTITATQATNVISLSGASLTAGASCTFQVNVTADATTGVRTNVTGAVTSNETGAAGTATASITVAAAPTIAKSFGVSTIPLSGTTSLTFNINNPNAGVTLHGIAFTDNLPAGLVVATPSGLSNTCGGTATAVAGSGVVTLTGATLGGSTPCVVSVSVKGTTAGIQNNSTQVSSTETGTGNTTNASVTVVAPPGILKGFGPATIPVNSSSTLTFTIQNSNTTTTLTGIGFSDTLPAGMTVATPNGLTGSCGGGTITATAGSGSVSLSGATLTVSNSCTFSVNVTATTAGTKNNVTGNVTSTEGGTGGAAAASIAVTASDLTIAKSHVGNFTQGQTGAVYTITVTNSGNLVTAGTVTVTDTPPAGLTATTASGTGWTCGVAIGVMTCTRADALAAAGSYPAITLNVNVASNAAASLTNTATVAGGGEVNIANDTASDVTTVTPFNTFTFTATIPSLTVTAGASATEHFTLTPTPAIGSTVTFACSNLPALATCTFVPASQPPTNSPVDIALTIATTAHTSSALERPRTFYAVWLPFSGLGLIGIVMIGRRRKNRKTVVVFIAAGLMMLLALAGCGGSSINTATGTPAGSYPVTVTATAGATTQSTNFTLVVQ